MLVFVKRENFLVSPKEKEQSQSAYTIVRGQGHSEKKWRLFIANTLRSL